MKKIIKFILIIPVILFVIYIGFLSYIKSSININSIKDNINKSLSDKIQEYKQHQLFLKKDIKFAIRGKINLSIFPTIKIIVNDININDVQYRDNILSINVKDVEFKLGFFNFLRKKISVNDIIVNTVVVNIQQNKLADFYIKKEIVKKIVKMEENEVTGIKTTIRNLLINNKNNDIQEGYKEIEVVEDVRVDLDNSEVDYMFLNLIKTIKIDSLSLKDNLKIEFSNSLLNYIRNGTVQKEIKSISGTLALEDNKINIKCNFLLNNINGNLDITYSVDKDKKNNIDIKLVDSMEDFVSINYIGNNPLITKYMEIIANIKANFNVKNYNDFSQWVILPDSKYYYLIDYKRAITSEINLSKNMGNIVNVKKFIINGEDVDIDTNLQNSNDFKLNININKLRLDNIIINTSKNKPATDDTQIMIFKTTDINELMSLSSENNKKNNKNGNIRINIKELSKESRTLKDSILDLSIENGSYIINNFNINLNGMKIDIANQEKIGELFVNNLKMEGQDFSDITKLFGIPNIFGIKEFAIESKIFAHNNVIYLINYNVKNGEQIIIGGSLEYSFDKTKSYIAMIMNLDNLSINIENKKSKTLKEDLLWLNNFTKNIFISLSINNLTYNKLSNINVKTKFNFSPGYLNLYDISNIDFENIKNIKGNFLLDIRNKTSVISADISILNITKDINLINNVFDIEKYKNILLRENINEKNRANYWVNKLFSFPRFDGINGNISLKIQDFIFNKLPIQNIIATANIENGTINITDMKFDGLGGKTNIKAIIDAKNTRKVSLTLNETVYSIGDLAKLFVGENKLIGDLTGNIGLAGIISGVGFNSGVFNSSLSMQFKLIGNNFLIKKIGLDDLRKKLSLVYTDKNLRDNFNTKEIIINETGTVFNNFSGTFVMNSGKSNLSLKAEGNGISSNLDLKVDSTDTNMTTINMISTSAIMVNAANNNFPLYINISFLEDFTNKAKLIINTSQIDQYIDQVRNISDNINSKKNTK